MEYAKVFLISALTLLASCGSSHKVVHDTKKTVDSSVISTIDSSHVMHEEESGDMFHLHDVHIRVEYPADTALAKAKETPADTTSWQPYYVPKKPTKAQQIAQALKDAISASGGAGRLPSVITIDIGSLSDSSGRTTRSDSSGIRAIAKVDLHTVEVSKDKDVTHTGLPLGLKFGIGLFFLIVLLVVIWRLWQKFKPL